MRESTVNASVRTFEDLQFAAVIAAIGSQSLEGRLLHFLHDRFGADNCVLYKFGPDGLTTIGMGSFDRSNTTRDNICLYLNSQNWRRDPTIHQAQRALTRDEPSVFRQDPKTLKDMNLREQLCPRLAERILICGGRFSAGYGFSISRSLQHDMFSSDDVAGLERAADPVLAVVARHADAVDRNRNSAAWFTSSAEIAKCIKSMQESLSRRETEVCAGILRGLSTEGIAVMLNIGQESVATYRKRAYLKLGISSKHELLSWYFSL